MHEDYFVEIEAHFALRRGTPFLFSAKDWLLMQTWAEQQIPLSIVLEAIDQTFDHRAKNPRRRAINGLQFCKRAVQQLWDERKDLHVGGAGEIPERDPAAVVAGLATELTACARAAQDPTMRTRIEAAAEAVGLVGMNQGAPRIEEALAGIETTLMQDLVALVPAAEIAEIDAQIQRALRDSARVDPMTLQRTRDATIRRHVRTTTGIPRLSLFG